ncbi:hypothetical protein [Streptomyces sp. NPDC017260]|uniref:hypothetical protein n=1 Tax=unclassified Streptomyces TaxID=2593676 RepID=UPI0037B94C3B
MTSADRDRLADLDSDDTRLPPERETTPATGASRNRPTCQPVPSPPAEQDLTIQAVPLAVRPLLTALPVQPAAPAAETAPPDLETAPPDLQQREAPTPQATDTTTGLPTELITLQQAADAAHHKLQQFDDHQERDIQRQA